MKKQANILDPTLTALLDRYGVKLASAPATNKQADSSAPPVGKEPPMHDGRHVDSELAVDSSEDRSNPTPRGPLTHEDDGLLRNYLEGGLGVADWEHKRHSGKVPSGEQPSFGALFTGEGEKPHYTKTTTDPGYHNSKPDPELSISGKEAAFLESLEKFAAVQSKFLEDIAYITKLAAEEMNPQGAIQGMLGQGSGGTAGDEGGGEGGEGGELSPEEAAAAQQILQQNGDLDGGQGAGVDEGLGGDGADEELSPEEIQQAQQILQSYEDGGDGEAEGEEESLTPEEIQEVAISTCTLMPIRSMELIQWEKCLLEV
jgi:hypothetical protein